MAVYVTLSATKTETQSRASYSVRTPACLPAFSSYVRSSQNDSHWNSWQSLSRVHRGVCCPDIFASLFMVQAPRLSGPSDKRTKCVNPMRLMANDHHLPFCPGASSIPRDSHSLCIRDHRSYPPTSHLPHLKPPVSSFESSNLSHVFFMPLNHSFGIARFYFVRVPEPTDIPIQAKNDH